MILLALALSAFRPTRKASREELLFNIQQISQNFKQMKERARKFSTDVQVSEERKEQFMDELLSSVFYQNASIEDQHRLRYFQKLASKLRQEMRPSGDFDWDCMLIFSWFSATLLQLDEIMLATPVTREVLFMRVFKLSPKEMDLLQDGKEVNISRVIDVPNISLFLEFPKARDVYYLTLKVGNTRFDFQLIEDYYSDVARECVKEDYFDASKIQVLSGDGQMTRCARAMLTAMGSSFAETFKSLIVNNAREQLSDEVIQAWVDTDSKIPEGGITKGPEK